METDDEVRLFYNDQHQEPIITLNQSSRPINDTIDNSDSDISTCTPVSSSTEFADSEEEHLSQSKTEYPHDDENMPIFKPRKI